MGVYTKTAMRMFSQLTDKVLPYFLDIKLDLKKARMRISLQEYISNAILTSFLIFICEIVILSFIFGLVLQSFLFGFITAFTASIFLSVIFFYAYLNYPKIIIKERAKNIDSNLPYASLYLATIAGSKLPLHKTLEVFAKFSKHGQLKEEISRITNEIDAFGIDVNTALERAIERTPSKDLKELLWGILSVNRSGGDVDVYLKEKSKTYVAEFRRRLFEFSRQLAIFLEVYITAVILGAVFFTILTSIMGGIAGGAGNVIIIQFILIFIFIPLISVAFIVLIRAMSPGGE